MFMWPLYPRYDHFISKPTPILPRISSLFRWDECVESARISSLEYMLNNVSSLKSLQFPASSKWSDKRWNIDTSIIRSSPIWYIHRTIFKFQTLVISGRTWRLKVRMIDDPLRRGDTLRRFTFLDGHQKGIENQIETLSSNSHAMTILSSLRCSKVLHNAQWLAVYQRVKWTLNSSHSTRKRMSGSHLSPRDLVSYDIVHPNGDLGPQLLQSTPIGWVTLPEGLTLDCGETTGRR